jgi:hypothetical protein
VFIIECSHCCISADDVVGFHVNPNHGLTCTEAGGTDVFTLALYSKPTSSVVIAVNSSDTTEGLLGNVSAVTFTPGTWFTAQGVTVTGVDDAGVDGNVVFSVLVSAAASDDTNYASIDANDVVTTTSDGMRFLFVFFVFFMCVRTTSIQRFEMSANCSIADDIVGISANPANGLTCTEAGGTAVFTLVLTSQPSQNVLVSVNSSDGTEGNTTQAILTFRPKKWATLQTVTATGADDYVFDGNVAFSFGVTASAGDTNYHGLVGPLVSVTTNDGELRSAS